MTMHGHVSHFLLHLFRLFVFIYFLTSSCSVPGHTRARCWWHRPRPWATWRPPPQVSARWEGRHVHPSNFDPRPCLARAAILDLPSLETRLEEHQLKHPEQLREIPNKTIDHGQGLKDSDRSRIAYYCINTAMATLGENFKTSAVRTR